MQFQRFKSSIALALIGAFAIASPSVADQPMPVDVPSQPLLDALNELGEETGLQIVVSENVYSGVVSRNVSGQMSPKDALAEMLHGTGIVIQSVSETSAALSFADVASQNANKQPLDLGTLVLEGELLPSTLQDSPTSAAVFTGEALAETGDTSVFDIYNRVANVTTLNNSGVSIRGISEFGVAGGTAGSTISIQSDGVALPGRARWLNPTSTWDLGQLEILRGPQSTQQGANALAGAVIARSNDPIFGDEYAVRGDLGTFNSRRFALMGNTEWVPNRLAFRFSADLEESDGFVYNPTRNSDTVDTRSFESYRAALRWAATDSLDLVLSFRQSDRKVGSDVVSLQPFPAGRVNFSNEINAFGAETQILGLRGTWDINDVFTLDFETSYYTIEYYRYTDADSSPVATGFITEDGDYEGFEQDLRLRFETDRARGVIGLFLSDASELTRGRGFRAQAETLPEPFRTVVLGVEQNVLGGQQIFLDGRSTLDTTTRNAALFGEVDIPIEWLPGVTLTAGARYDYEEFDFRRQTVTTTPQQGLLDQIVNGTIPSPPGTAGLVSALVALAPNRTETSKTDYQAFLPKLGLTYDFSADQSVSFTVQRGYRAGGAGESTISGAFSFEPEYTDNYELAYRGTFVEGALDVSANIFYTRWTDQQVNVTLGPLDTRVVNAGESELYGFEASAEFRPNAQLSLYGSVGYVHTEFLEFVDNGVNLAGNRFPGAPEVTASLGGRYLWNNGVSAGLDLAFTDSYFLNATNLPGEKSDAFWVLNANVNYTLPNGLVLGAYVRNLLDEDYVVNRFLLATFPGGTGRAGAPRTLGVFASYRF